MTLPLSITERSEVEQELEETRRELFEYETSGSVDCWWYPLVTGALRKHIRRMEELLAERTAA
jgi:hypothetical protein